MNTCGIYQIKNKITKKVYIGSSTQPSNRWYYHLHALRNNHHANCRLQAAFIKYGEEALEFTIIESCEKENLLIREQYWIDSLNSVSKGYNIVSIAGSAPDCSGKKLTEEHKIKIGKSKLGKKRKPFSLEWRQKLKIAAKKPRPNQSKKMRAFCARPEYKAEKALICIRAWETRRKRRVENASRS